MAVIGDANPWSRSFSPVARIGIHIVVTYDLRILGDNFEATSFSRLGRVGQSGLLIWISGGLSRL